MKLITKQIEAIIAVERFGRNTLDLRNNPMCKGDYRDKYAALLSLGDTPDFDEVNQICGSSLPPLLCDECGQRADVGVRFGDDDDYNNQPREFCIACLRKALALIESS